MEKEKEFNLKEKSYCKKCGVGYIFRENMPGCKHEWVIEWFWNEEFIRQLKEHTSCKDKNNCLVLKQDEIHKIIDKLSGFEE